VLGAERVGYCAAIDAAGGAESWALAPELEAVSGMVKYLPEFREAEC